jgi:predicted TIM-barrel fold metal-dependent hydrolase
MTPVCAPPDPNPRPSERLRPPPLACDCHMHVFGPASEYPYIDARRYTPPDASIEAYQQMLAALGIERSVMVQPSVYGFDNRASLEAMRVMNRRHVTMRGVAVVGPGVHENELEEMHTEGVRGIRFNLQTGGTDLRALEMLAAKVSELNWHIQMFPSADVLAELADRLELLPTDVVIDHMGNLPAEAGMGHPGGQALLKLLANGRTWVKLSGPYRLTRNGPPYDDVTPIGRALVEAAPERCVWGTDWPHPHFDGPMPNDGQLLDTLAAFAPDPATQKLILADNPATLYQFD